MEFKCHSCNKSFNSEESLSQHNASKHKPVKSKKAGFRKYLVSGLVVLIIAFLSLTVYSSMQGPGDYDNFAKCLSEKGAVIYGNDFCQYTNKQLNFFGKSKKYLNYVKCFDNKQLCDEKNIMVTPTWEINGKMYEQVQSFDVLSALTGCEV